MVTVMVSTPAHSPLCYGMQIRLRHLKTDRLLFSLDRYFDHANSSNQQMVVATRALESGTLWLVKPRHESAGQVANGTPVRRGELIRLEHVLTRRNLHSHPNIPAPKDKTQQEVTACGDGGFCDTNDDWILELT